MKRIIALLCALLLTAVLCSACNLFPFFGVPVPRQPQPVLETEEVTVPATESATEPVTEEPTDAPIGTLSDYVRTAKEKTVDFGSGNTNTLRLPAILIESWDALQASNEIMERFGDVVESGSDYSGAHTLDYEAYLNGKVLSVVVFAKYDGGNSYGLCYNFDVTTGERIDSEALCDILGESYSEMLDVLYDELTEYYEEMYATLPGNDTEREKTYNYSNLKAASFYLDGDADLMAMIDIYAAVGGGHWVAQLEVD